MNFQDLTEFMDLVKNPTKYDKYLNELKDARDQLTTAAELVGKASDIEKLQKKAVKAVEVAEAKAAEIEATATRDSQQRQAAYDTLFEEHRKVVELFNAEKQIAENKQAVVAELEKSLNERERALRKNLQAYELAAADLTAKTQEVEDKLAKLRAAMV
jgi:cell fate regulator YaaT (PSP1 superfamily)